MASDPIGFELFRNTLLSIADEMALTILRTAYSGVLRDNMDYSTAFCDGAGRTVAQGLTLPAHLSSFPDALAATIARYGDRMQPGDIYCLNDPFEGGMHIPDVFVLKPSSSRASASPSRRPSATRPTWAAAWPAPNASDSTEIYQEGLRIPPVKMYDRGSRTRRCSASSRRTCASPFACSVTCARSWPRATSQRKPSSASSTGTASSRSRRTWRTCSTTPSG